METSNFCKGNYNVFNENVSLDIPSLNRISNCTYAYNESRESHMYATIEEPSMYINPRETLTVDDGSKFEKADETLPIAVDPKLEKGVKQKNSLCVGKRRCKRVQGILMFLLVIVIAVIGYFLVSTLKKGSGHCPNYSDIENGKVMNTTGYNHGDVLEISCNENSKLVGSNVITCLSSSKWSSSPKCELKTCDEPVVPSTLQIESTQNNFVVGTEIVVKCIEGYELDGNNTLICHFDETWSDVPTCQAVNCGIPDDIANSKINDLFNTTYNHTFDVECREGYSLKGNETVKCTKSGRWEKLPKCEVISCGLPDIPIHGSMTNITGMIFQATALIICVEGYKLTGNSTINCQANGLWSTGARCTEIECPKYTHIENGRIARSTGFQYGDVLEILCDENSKLVGPNVITCLSSGQWNPSTECVLKTCTEPMAQENMFLQSVLYDYVVGTEIAVTCTEGYEVYGNKSIICQHDETWSAGATCKAVDCGNPMRIPNAEIIDLLNTTYNSSFSVECGEGYELKGNTIIKCLASGRWAQLPTCELISCGSPDAPTHGTITNITETLFNATAIVECDKGYYLNGNMEIFCLSSGHWTAGTTCTKTDSSDCFDILKQDGLTENGIYFITTWQKRQEIQVYCDMSTNGGGWTVFQYRFNGSVDFYRNFSEYENGFGNLKSEFWLGLRLLREMISQNTTELWIEVTAANNSDGFEIFQNFTLAGGPDYTVNFEKGGGNMKFGLRGFVFNKGCRFSTYDHDADRVDSNCAGMLHGGWWYNGCGFTNLNGHYAVPGTVSKYHVEAGMTYKALHDNWESLMTSKMMFRRQNP